MKVSKIIGVVCLASLISSCKGQNRVSIHPEEPLPVEIHRFDQAVFRLVEHDDSLGRAQLAREYPAMLGLLGKGVLNMKTPEVPGFFDKLVNFYGEPTLRGLYRDALAAYDSLADIRQSLGLGLAYLKANFPAMQIPAVYMHVSGFNQNVLAGDSVLSLSIDKYLGPDYALYQDFFYDYQRRKMKREQVAADYLAGWLMSEYPFTGKENVLLERMIYEGKLKYLVSDALPWLPETSLMGYTGDEAAWCRASEGAIWKRMVERKHLYTPDLQTTSRYFDEAPAAFLSGQAPGNLGSWMGWQIVSRFMEETGTTPEALMNDTDAADILARSKYKP